MEREDCDSYIYIKYDYPPAYRDPKKKTISVIQGLDCDNIQVRFVASYNEWGNLEDTFLKKGGALDAEDVTPFIKNGLNKISGKILAEQVQLFSKKDPDGFAWEFYWNFIVKAQSENPLIVTSRSLGYFIGMTKEDVEKLKWLSKWVYAFLLHWLKQPSESRADECQSPYPV